jgi:lipid A 4'-phosphatase
LALVFVFLVSVLLPEFDIWVSGLFYDQATDQWAARSPFLTSYRHAFNYLSVGLAVTCLCIWFASVLRGPIVPVPRAVWAFVPLLYFLGPGLLVNVLLKSHWGRARPADIIEFGGDKHFSSAFLVSDQCDRNCSFVSGEGAGATAFIISVLVVAAYISNRKIRQSVIGLALFCGMLAISLRLFTGRHFLSDTLGAVIFISLIAVLLHWLLLAGTQRREVAETIDPVKDH